MIWPSSQRPRPLRPLFEGDEAWIYQLGSLFRLHGTHDVWQDEIFMVVTTWYINHAQHTRCNRPRDVQLIGLPVTWIDGLRHVWADLLDPQTPFSIHIVEPRPPQFRESRSVCHIILEQHQLPAQAAVVLTALLEGYTGDGIIQGAFSTERQLTLATVISIAELQPFCSQRRCTLIQDGQPVHEDHNIAVATGSSLRVRIESNEPLPPSSDPTEHLHFEDLSLLQRPAFPTEADMLEVEMQPAIEVFEWLDTHFTLPSFMIPHETIVPHESLTWTHLPLWDPSVGGEEVWVYFDGSFQSDVAHAGIAVALYVRQSHQWYQAGFLSSQILHAGSYTAELYAAIVAAKAVHDLLKMLALTTWHPPTVWLCYDSLTVGNQLLGHWKCVQFPILGRCLRMLIELIEARFPVTCQGWHIHSHQGEPGNEFVDALAKSAVSGQTTHDLGHFFAHILRKEFVDPGEWMWILFAEQYAAHWRDMNLCFSFPTHHTAK